MQDTLSLLNLSLVDVFNSIQSKTHNQRALTYNDSQLTYSQLDERSNQIANWLLEKKINKGDCVAILLAPGIDYIILILSIIKAGAIYVPLDNLAPDTRLKEIITDSKPKLVISDEQHYHLLKAIDTAIHMAKQINLQSASFDSNPINIKINSYDPVYMMYTSGSTGKPKGVIISHQSIINLVKIDNYAQIDQHDRVGQFSSLAFDGSTFEIWSALLNGSELVIIPKEKRTNLIEFKNYLENTKISYLFLPTGYLHQLIKTAPDTLNSVKCIIFGGEQANVQLVKYFLSYRKQKHIPIKLINGYGPTEATTFTCRHVMDEKTIMNEEQLGSIGFPIQNVALYILDETLNEAPEGELYIGGINLALGYHNSIEQNKSKFIDNPFAKSIYPKLYKTGDKATRLPTGEYVCLGRLDDQVKIGGFRIHLNEIEKHLMKHEAISLAAVTVEMGGENHQILTAYLVLSNEFMSLSGDTVRAFLAKSIPTYMLPAKYVQIEELPLTLVGKVDKRKLPLLEHIDLSVHIDTSTSHYTEKIIKSVWMHLLNLKHIDIQKNFFELGANSLLLTEACQLINQRLNTNIQINDLLAHSTIKKLSLFIEGDIDVTQNKRNKTASLSNEIAIVGMSCRVPGSPCLDDFWKNLCEGNDCLTRLNIEAKEHTQDYIPVRGTLNGIELFDASFFGFSPADAKIMDPQHRLFMECTWEALEHAGIAPNKSKDIISVYSGMTDSTYLTEYLLKSKQFLNEHDFFQQRIATSTGMLSTLISYKLNLKGRSINVNSACSTGLLAVEQACQDLMLGYSDTAIAGASSIIVPQDKGYYYYPGSIVSKTGYCRPFDSEADGTVFSNGIGVVILKRLEDAIKEGHTIYAIIKGRGVNNDGSDKLGYTAPSINGQISCINEALTQAQIEPHHIGLIEAHGTATALGDVVEINALKTALQHNENTTSFCALGSVKANIGHTDVASGVISLIKAALCLYYKKIPPQIHFKHPNPALSLETSPFYVNKELIPWDTSPRYAGVSAFGVGGTNVHLIVKEHCPLLIENELNIKEELFLFSAKSKQALQENENNFIKFMYEKENQTLNWENLAFTLHKGREDFIYRKFGIGITSSSLASMLSQQLIVRSQENIQYNIVWMFSGQGTQYHHMAKELCEKVPLFKKYFLDGINIANSYLNIDLLELINNENTSDIHLTQYAQPALFIIEYSLARLLMDCGLKPNLLIGHSLGEYVAACIADVFTYEDALALVCERGLLMAQAPKGEMLAIECTIDEAIAFKNNANVDIALHNATNYCVLAGLKDELEKIEPLLVQEGKAFQRLKVSHAFHSHLMEPIKPKFIAMFDNIRLSPPKIPIVSNVTGTWLSAKEATDSSYWYQHLRQTVQFSKGIDLLLEDKHSVFIEIGLGHSLCNFVKTKNKHKECIIYVLPNHHKKTSDLYQLLFCLGFVWTKGISINLNPLYENKHPQLIAAPTYAFQRKKYWVESNKSFKESLDSSSEIDTNSTLIKMPSSISTLTSLEQELSALFSKSLGIEHIGLHDDFFDLGGHSLIAIKLINEINTQYNAKLTIQNFSMAPTVAKIIHLLNREKSEPIPILFPFKINPTSSKCIFLCHPISGVITGLRSLAETLPSSYSVYGLQDPSASGEELNFANLQSMATRYLQEIIKIQPKGPYYLIGYSFGGNLVYEIAYQLSLKNESVALLCLIDSWAKHPKDELVDNQIINLINTHEKPIANLLEVSKNRASLLLKHTPSKIEQEMIIVKAMHTLDCYGSINHPTNHWSSYNVGRIICCPLNGTHESVIEKKYATEMVSFLIKNKYL